MAINRLTALAKKYICGTLPFTALQVIPTMTTSAAEKPGNVKKVHCNADLELKKHLLLLPML